MSRYSAVEITFTIERDGEQIDLDIEGNVEPSTAASFRGNPDNWTPPEGGDTEVTSIACDGVAWDGKLTVSEEDDVHEALREQARSDWESAAEDAAVDRAEDARYGD